MKNEDLGSEKSNNSLKNSIVKEELKKRNIGDCEIIVLEGKAEPVFHESSINVKGGAINSVFEYLSKKIVKTEIIENSKIEFCYDKLYINLLYDARQRNPDLIEGSLKLHPDLLKFNINSGKPYGTYELSDFIKMNRHYFENKDYAMKLVSQLRDFEGKVSRDLEQKGDDRGNKRALINQVVESNIPASFILELPVFVGQNKIRLEVEVSINASFECTLISPDLKELIDIKSKEILGEQLKLIRDLHPELKVFEL
ncbi:hypothetical protein [Flavobacterium johnsoniae]|uniref:Uncharacterized protein n=1 Tax=Flavobacterium johnsoniae TaxID=986 RepID=A0A1M5IK14_FLAJO|nr:hypothetical protein [Flavobacterium johnsoniae]SHG28399.1 hypothetical protein SAMN05444388_102128 [Flavobacterium johnsoniae]